MFKKNFAKIHLIRDLHSERINNTYSSISVIKHLFIYFLRDWSLFIYLFIFGCVGSLFLREGFL